MAAADAMLGDESILLLRTVAATTVVLLVDLLLILAMRAVCFLGLLLRVCLSFDLTLTTGTATGLLGGVGKSGDLLRLLFVGFRLKWLFRVVFVADADDVVRSEYRVLMLIALVHEPT